LLDTTGPDGERGVMWRVIDCRLSAFKGHGCPIFRLRISSPIGTRNDLAELGGPRGPSFNRTRIDSHVIRLAVYTSRWPRLAAYDRIVLQLTLFS